MPVYSHWFSLALYNVACSFKDQLAENKEVYTVSLEGVNCELDCHALDWASELIRKAATSGQERGTHGMISTPSLALCETTLSTVVSVALNQLCFKNSYSGFIVHQGPVRKKPKTQGNPDTADLLGGRILNDAYMGESFFISDLKLTDADIADKETALYGKFVSKE